MMIQDVFLDRLKPIHFKEQINIIYMRISIYDSFMSEKDINNNYINDIKVYKLKPDKEKKKIFSYLIFKDGKFQEIFFNFDNYLESISNISIFDRYYQTYRNHDKYVKSQMLDNKVINNLYMITIYEYQYIKGTNGKKQLLPIETRLNNKLKYNETIRLCNHFLDYNVNFFNTLEYYFKYKGKKNKYDKILYFIFKGKKSNYFNLLTDDLKFHICKFL